MSNSGYVNLGALKTEIRKLCKSFGLDKVEVRFEDDRRGITVRPLGVIDLQENTGVDPTEESNAVCWGDN